MKIPTFFFPQLLLVAVVLLLSFSNGSCRKAMMENVSIQDSASTTTVLSSVPLVAETEMLHFHLDYVEAGPNFNGKSSLPYPTPPPSTSPSPLLPQPPPPQA